MKLVKLVFNEIENACEMYNGKNRLELFTYSEGEVALAALKPIEMLGVIVVEVEYK